MIVGPNIAVYGVAGASFVSVVVVVAVEDFVVSEVDC